KEKEAVFAVHHMGNRDGAAQRGAILIAMQVVPRQAFDLVEEGVGVEIAVAEELKDAAMNGVGAGFGRHADHAGAIPPIFGCVVTGQNAEFGNRIGIGIVNHPVRQNVVVDAAIQQIGDRVWASAA